MSRLTKTLLLATVANFIPAVLFLTGFVNVSNAPGLYVSFPLAAIFFGLTLLSRMMQKEVAAFDAEQRAHQVSATATRPQELEETVHGHEHHAPIGA